MVEIWDYRYELINFQRHRDGSCSYTTREEGEVQLADEPPTGILKLMAWQAAREKAEKTGKDVIVYVKGERIITRTKSIMSESF